MQQVKCAFFPKLIFFLNSAVDQKIFFQVIVFCVVFSSKMTLTPMNPFQVVQMYIFFPISKIKLERLNQFVIFKLSRQLWYSST